MNFFFELEHFVITGSNPTIFFLSPAVSNEEKALKHNKRIVKSEIACKKPLGEGQGQSNAGSSSSSSGSATASNLQSIQTLTAQQGLLNMGSPGAPTSNPVGQPMVQYPWSTTEAPTINSSAHQASVMAMALRDLARAGAGLPGMNPAAASAAYGEILKLSLQAQQAKGGQQNGNPLATGSQKIDSDDTDDSFDNIENENEVRMILYLKLFMFQCMVKLAHFPIRVLKTLLKC